MIWTCFWFRSDEIAVYLSFISSIELVAWICRCLIYLPLILRRTVFRFLYQIDILSWLSVIHHVFIFLRIRFRGRIWFNSHLILIDFQRVISWLRLRSVTRSSTRNCGSNSSILLNWRLHFRLNLLGCYLMLENLLRVSHLFLFRELMKPYL